MHQSPRGGYVAPVATQSMESVLSMAGDVTRSRQRRKSFSACMGLASDAPQALGIAVQTAQGNIERVAAAAAGTRQQSNTNSKGRRGRRASFSDALKTLEGKA